MEAIIPEWIPNIHPLIVHYPIALWAVAILFDFLLLFKTVGWIRNMVMSLYGLCVFGGLAAYLSGKQAIESVAMPMQAEVSASKHADWGLYTLYFFAAYVLLRLFFFRKQWDKKKWVAVLLFVAAIGGLVILTYASELGGKLVYKYGVGTVK